MKAGKKKNRSTAEKITKFPLDPSGMEDLEDAELDELLEKELKREADELEARLNSDPKLIGVGASDDLFAKIVGSLKAQGVWEENEEAVNVQENGAGEADAEKAGETEDKNREIEAKYEDESVTASEKTKTTEKKATESVSKIEQQSEVVAEKTVEENTAGSADKNIQKIEKVESNEAEEKNTAEDVVFSNKERDSKSGSEEAYSQLSEADRRAMEYGYQMQQKDAEKKVRRKKRRKIAKRAGITAAALVAVFGVSMTSDANRRYVLEAWNTVVEKVGVRTGLNYVEEEPVYLGNTKEEEAQTEIKDKLNIKPMQFNYLPTDWKFSSYEVNEDAGYAIFLYSDGENWMHVLMKKNEDYVENVTYFQLDRDITKVGEVVNGQNIKIDLYTDSEQSYIAILEKDEDYYRINVKISYEEMVNILKYTAF